MVARLLSSLLLPSTLPSVVSYLEVSSSSLSTPHSIIEASISWFDYPAAWCSQIPIFSIYFRQDCCRSLEILHLFRKGFDDRPFATQSHLERRREWRNGTGLSAVLERIYFKDGSVCHEENLGDYFCAGWDVQKIFRVSVRRNYRADLCKQLSDATLLWAFLRSIQASEIQRTRFPSTDIMALFLLSGETERRRGALVKFEGRKCAAGTM